MSAESIALIAGSILSLVFSYVPGLNAKFAALGPEVKRLIMLGLLVVVAVGAFGLACTGYGANFNIATVCDVQGALGLGGSLLLAIIANQAVYAVSPKTPAVQEARKDAAFEALAE